MDKLKLIKFLNLSSSSYDSESLSAIRKANILLKENNVSWEELLKEKPEIKQPEKDEYVILHMNLQKERAYSQELKDNFEFSKVILKYLSLLIVILIVIIILK